MMLLEEGAFELNDPVADLIPSFADIRVYAAAPSQAGDRPATEPIRIWHLLTHTAGLTYGFHHAHPVDALYRAGRLRVDVAAGLDLAGAVDALAACRCCSSPAPSGTTPSPPTCSAGSSRSPPGSRSTASSPSASSTRSA